MKQGMPWLVRVQIFGFASELIRSPCTMAMLLLVHESASRWVVVERWRWRFRSMNQTALRLLPHDLLSLSISLSDVYEESSHLNLLSHETNSGPILNSLKILSRFSLSLLVSFFFSYFFFAFSLQLPQSLSCCWFFNGIFCRQRIGTPAKLSFSMHLSLLGFRRHCCWGRACLSSDSVAIFLCWKLGIILCAWNFGYSLVQYN